MELKKDFTEFDLPSEEQWLKVAESSLNGKPLEKLEKVNSFGFKNKALFSSDLENDLGNPEKTKLLSKLLPNGYVSSLDLDARGADPITQISYLLRLVQEEKKANVLISTDGNVFINIAKLRALRKLLNALENENIISDITITVTSTMLNKSNLDVNNNILRLTLECFSSIVGGADFLHLNDFKGNGGEFEKRITNNIYHILNEESYLNNAVDPAKGSSYIEELTEYIANLSWNRFHQLQEMDIHTAFNKSKISADRHFEILSDEINSRKKKMIGVNIYPYPEDKISNFNIGGAEKRLSHAYEIFRVNASNYFIKNQNEATINIYCFGKLKEYKARLDFITDFFEVGAFKIVSKEFELSEDAINTILLEENPVNVILANDKIYKELIPELSKAIKAKNDELELIIAGYPKDDAERYQKNGIDRFIHIKSNIFNELTKTWEKFL